MKRLALLLYLLLACCTHNNHVEKGTTFAVWVTHDSTVMAVDSRVGRTDRYGSKTHTDTSCKIFRYGSYFVVYEGISNIGDVPMREKIKQYFDTTQNIENACDILSKKLAAGIQNYWNSLSLQTRITLSYNRDSSSSLHFSAIIVKYKKNTHIICSIFIGNKLNNYNAVVIPSKPITTQKFNGLITGGFNESINALPSSHRFFTGLDKVVECANLIYIEASKHEDVDSVVNYVIVKPNRFTFGKYQP
ncbi:hypothetical protein [Mucilaginibacter flavidus]|uniref:hypothetical protein n=1 Tax=Mucilaginibacter flavidus TaxID=2949309 RepID=UPI002093016E|nr:hypothetical protein [Mucilaginibacter flavidus]MCO5951202.1 hypothetical protein [Mucilaginibacter flavidus]